MIFSVKSNKKQTKSFHFVSVQEKTVVQCSGVSLSESETQLTRLCHHIIWKLFGFCLFCFAVIAQDRENVVHCFIISSFFFFFDP